MAAADGMAHAALLLQRRWLHSRTPRSSWIGRAACNGRGEQVDPVKGAMYAAYGSTYRWYFLLT